MNYLQYTIVFNTHAYTTEFFSDIFIEPFFFPKRKQAH